MEARVQEKNTGAMHASRVCFSYNNPLKVSIGIPAYNEEGSIGVLLNELLAQLDSNIVEIVVSDDGSTDRTCAEVLQVAGKAKNSHGVIRLIKGKQRCGKAAAIDRILKVAQGDVVVLMDADTKLSKNCVSRLVDPFSHDKSIYVVSGNVLPLNSSGESKFFSFASSFQRELNDQLSQRLLDKNQVPKVNGAFFAFRKKVVDHIPQMVVSDDEYVSWCAQTQGHKVTYVSDAKVYAKDPMNVRDYLAKRRRVLGGHFLIKNTSHYVVPTTRIDVLAPVFGRLAAKYWKKGFYMIAMVIFESLCRLFAFSDAIQGKVSPRYRAESSKSFAKKL
jgi:cellulose synthase/poly-beta-1,6-N-acetylglucosamine synthase-like glycosyltransferase